MQEREAGDEAEPCQQTQSEPGTLDPLLAVSGGGTVNAA
jgi:hypothetical protein